jgi:serine/threonine protein phosphatase PrpC
LFHYPQSVFHFSLYFLSPHNNVFRGRIQLVDDDEFVILGCDGIWDCLSNEKAVEFVLERINVKSITEIGIEMLDSIISINPQTTQGIGGDNMTILIVDLQPQKRTNVPPTSIATSTSTSRPTPIQPPPSIATTSTTITSTSEIDNSTK